MFLWRNSSWTSLTTREHRISLSETHPGDQEPDIWDLTSAGGIGTPRIQYNCFHLFSNSFFDPSQLLYPEHQLPGTLERGHRTHSLWCPHEGTGGRWTSVGEKRRTPKLRARSGPSKLFRFDCPDSWGGRHLVKFGASVFLT